MGELYDKLQPNYKAFVDEWLKSCILTRAAQAAGSTAKNLSQAGKQLLSKAEINAAIKEMQVELADSLEVTPERVLREFARIGFSDPRKMLDAENRLLPIVDLDDDMAAAVASVEVVETGGEALVTTKKVKLWDKRGALDSLAKHLGLFERDNEQRAQPIAAAIEAYERERDQS